ncbi:conserved protein of unknown function [Rhodovastum atsumiense]|uniref:Uncharacterized protein n=1 Tax=Rhodovastum atsumiense TaxID=504468 RepID=A0A5M6IY44_9PROT|nr:hypothetical protein [Rhodovastum atsumiense]KAA5612285.1 hypothetical protein F1189_10305 [Rhodovastum atsumiense]CAH2601616.1 conserved protein of unknown function [Rhodovastum atsumiense]
MIQRKPTGAPCPVPKPAATTQAGIRAARAAINARARNAIARIENSRRITLVRRTELPRPPR